MYHLAQCNIGRLRAPLDSPELAGFVAGLAPINALADAAPGFVWRLQTEAGDATAIRAFDDDMLIVNISVWESIEALAAFTYGGGHLEILRQRRAWFERMTDAYLVLWWIEAGTVPTVDEAKRRLATLDRHGLTPEAFTMRAPFRSPEAITYDEAPDDWLCPT